MKQQNNTEQKPLQVYNDVQEVKISQNYHEQINGLLKENEDLKRYVDYAAAKISFGSMPYIYENWVEVGKPDYE